jgi:hypothetical protein
VRQSYPASQAFIKLFEDRKSISGAQNANQKFQKKRRKRMNRKVFEALIDYIEVNKEVSNEDDWAIELTVPYKELAEFIAKLYKENH